MLTVYECAVLSEAAYADNSLRPILSRGFRAYSQRGEGGGFFARSFYRGDVVVVAFAGTDDFEDGLDDLQFRRRIPENQARQAAKYFADIVGVGRFRSADTTFVVTGHSLGGGLAKHVLLKNDAVSAAVAFNAPLVGGLEGVNQSMGTLLNVNTLGDPVSGLTRSMGKFEIGETLVQRIQPYQRPWLRRMMARGTGSGAVVAVVAEEALSRGEQQIHHHSMAPLRAALANNDLGRRTVP